jgi:hypothetical protein
LQQPKVENRSGAEFYIYINPESELLQMFFCHLSYPTNAVAHGLIIDPDALLVC